MTAAADLAATSSNVERFLSDAVKRAVRDLQRPITAQAKRDTGGDMRLSRSRGGRLNVKATVGGSGGAAHGTVEPAPRRMMGPWRWLEDGTRPRAQGRGRHPGTRPERTWSRPANKAIPNVERDLLSRFESVVR